VTIFREHRFDGDEEVFNLRADVANTHLNVGMARWPRDAELFARMLEQPDCSAEFQSASARSTPTICQR